MNLIMNSPMKKLVLLTVMLFAMISGYSQYVIVETAIKSHKYDWAQISFANYVQVGYQFNERWSVGLEYGRSTVEYEIRMPDNKSSTSSWADLFNVGNLFGGRSKDNKVYKPYRRTMNSYRSKINFHISPNFKIYAGPAIRFNTVSSKPTNQITYEGELYSDLEFGDYKNIGGVFGFDYICSLDGMTYMTLGMDIQFDRSSSSNIVSGSKFIGRSTSFGLGFGRRIGGGNSEK